MSDRKMEVATEILRQLGGSGRLKAMIGAKDFVATEKDGMAALSIRFTAKNKKGINFITIALNASDLYHVAFFKARKLELKQIEFLRDIDCENLKSAIEETTGLHLSL